MFTKRSLGGGSVDAAPAGEQPPAPSLVQSVRRRAMKIEKS